jgi:hypothetical protein
MVQLKLNLSGWLQDQQASTATLIGGVLVGGASLGLLYKWSNAKNGYKKKPSSFELSGGAVNAKEVKDTVSAGWESARELSMESLGTPSPAFSP